MELQRTFLHNASWPNNSTKHEGLNWTLFIKL